MMPFSRTYEEARDTFLAAVDEGGFRPLRFRVPHEDTSDLFLDFALLRRNPKRVLLHLAGVHGIEGYAGSAVQASLLRQPVEAEGASLLFVHAVNPYGMKFYRRANGQNVDLNRNYRTGPARPNSDYALFSSFLNPPDLGSFRREKLKALFRAFRMGKKRAAQAIASGQVSEPRGLFYMGDRVQREIQVLQDLLQHHCGEADEVVVLDFHTGLGAFKQEQLFVDHDVDPEAAAFTERTFASAPEKAQEQNYVNQGRLSDAIRAALPKARVRYVLQEMGARSPLKTLDALRLENYEWQRRPAGSDRPPEIIAEMMDAFCPEDEGWRRKILADGMARWNQAESYLRG
jgi:hypothetical protein